MDCVNHTGVSATAYCQSCGKALCATCVRNAGAGQILCEPCLVSWQTLQQPFAAAHSSGPNPAAATVLGFIPGVGAMYNGQFFKGFIHVAIFAVLISITDHFPIFGLFIAAWIVYQVFEANQTARAIQAGQTPPDPLGLNEVGNWLNLGARPRTPGQPAPYRPWTPPGSASPGTVNPGTVSPGPVDSVAPSPGSDPSAAGYQPPYYPASQDASGQAQYQPPYQSGWQAPFTPPVAGFVDPAAQPVPPGAADPSVPPPHMYWGRKEPIGAIVLIALGLLFLLNQFDLFNGRLFQMAWPLALIALGVWMVVRLDVSRGGTK
jgi:TM2 domain-containing membrane protein YozV